MTLLAGSVPVDTNCLPTTHTCDLRKSIYLATSTKIHGLNPIEWGRSVCSASCLPE